MNLKTIKKLLIIALLLGPTIKSIGNGTNGKDLQLNVDPAEVANKIIDNIEGRRWGWRYQKVCTYYGALIFADA